MASVGVEQPIRFSETINEIRFAVYKIDYIDFPPSFHFFLFWISRHDVDSRGNLAARLGTEIGVDCRNLVPALLNLRPPIPIFFHGAACNAAKLTHLSRGTEREREREKKRATIPFHRAKIAYHWKKRLASLSPRAICSQHETAPRHVFFLFLFLFFNFNYSRVNVNCNRLGKCIRAWKETDAKQIDSNLSDCHTPRLRLFQGISEFSMHKRVERRYTQRSKKRLARLPWKADAVENAVLWHILVENEHENGY